MIQFKVKRGLNIVVGGLLGMAWLHQAGGSDPILINDKISCFFINDHWSLKYQDGKNMPTRLLRQIGKKVLRLRHFKICRNHSEKNIYHIIPKELKHD